MTTERDRRNQFQYELDQKLAEAKEEYLAEGREEGLAEGEAIGLEKGEKIGEARGIEVTKLATAKKMLAKNYPIDEISELTGLSIEDLNGIR